MRKALFFFGILDDEDMEWMLSSGIRREAEKGEVLIQQGKFIDSLFLLVDGLFKVTAGNIEVAQLKSGEIMGELSFVDSRPTSASVIAVEKSLVLALPRTLVSKRLSENTGFAARFYRAVAVFLADRLRASNALLGYGKAKPVQEDSEDLDEIDPDVLETLSIANMRFDRLQRRLR
jgi:CRP-like cAMP-binding protein